MNKNDYFREVREGETPTHWAVIRTDLKHEILTNDTFQVRDVSGFPLIKLGWFDASEKPKESGTYLVICFSGEVLLAKYDDAWWSLDTKKALPYSPIAAWSYSPTYETKKEPWEIAWHKETLKYNHTTADLIPDRESFKAGYLAGQKSEY